MKKLGLLIATFFKVGYFPIAPGTLTSFIAATVFFLVNYFFTPPVYAQIASIVLLFWIGIPICSSAEDHFGEKDPGEIVIDEVAGQMVALLFIPLSIWLYLAGFFLFRFFDILKPFPIKSADRIPGGLGIMLDDIVAGLFALGVLHLIIYVF